MLGFSPLATAPIGSAYMPGSTDDNQPVVVAVTVSPSAATLVGGATQQFTASVLGLNSPSQDVTWSAPAGTVDLGGLFTAPATTPGHQYINVTVTSVQDPSKSAIANVVVPGSSPPAPSGIFQSRRRSARRVQRFS